MLLAEVKRYLGVHEDQPNTDRSTQIDYWNHEVGAPLGSAFCAACLTQCGIQAVGRSNWPFLPSASVQQIVDNATNRGLFTKDPSKVFPGDLLVLYFDNLKRYAHIGVVKGLVLGHTVTSLDANTSPNPSDGQPSDRNGGWVVQKTRPLGPHSAFILWPSETP